ncbi:hypothetical protein A5736_20365 [Mycobacterium sp. SP-6446]|nr:hypothetical protein A5736_20365 [Mycobacterium sp. SP-6446]
MVGATIDLLAHQLFGSRVGGRSHRHIGRSQPADVTDIACYAEVRQQNPLPVILVINMSEHDVGGFDIAV